VCQTVVGESCKPDVEHDLFRSHRVERLLHQDGVIESQEGSEEHHLEDLEVQRYSQPCEWVTSFRVVQCCLFDGIRTHGLPEHDVAFC
jgi:hypothetical protein